jgi:hypothetical protein
VTGAQACHGWAFEIGSNDSLVEIEEGDEEEAISSFLDMGEGGQENPKRAPHIKVPKSAQIWAPREGKGF